jgi:hypothetical protein
VPLEADLYSCVDIPSGLQFLAHSERWQRDSNHRNDDTCASWISKANRKCFLRLHYHAANEQEAHSRNEDQPPHRHLGERSGVFRSVSVDRGGCESRQGDCGRADARAKQSRSRLTTTSKMTVTIMKTRGHLQGEEPEIVTEVQSSRGDEIVLS